jgi:hypothetical protein
MVSLKDEKRSDAARDASVDMKLELGASVTAFDATDFQRLGKFFDELPRPIDHVLVTGPGPYYAPLAQFDFEAARRDLEAHISLPLQVAHGAASKVRPRREPALHRRHRWPPHGSGTRVDLGSHRRASRHDEEPRARTRARPCESDRGGVR